MATGTLDWSHCPAVESIPGKVSGAWVFRGTRMPAQIVFGNLEAGVRAVLRFASQSVEKPRSFGSLKSCSIMALRDER